MNKLMRLMKLWVMNRKREYTILQECLAMSKDKQEAIHLGDSVVVKDLADSQDLRGSMINLGKEDKGEEVRLLVIYLKNLRNFLVVNNNQEAQEEVNNLK